MTTGPAAWLPLLTIVVAAIEPCPAAAGPLDEAAPLLAPRAMTTPRAGGIQARTAAPAEADGGAAPPPVGTAPDSTTSAPTPRTVLWRSALLPGWGQWTTGHRWKAVLLAGAGAGWLAATAVEAARVDDARDPAGRVDRTARRNTRVLWYLITATVAGIDAYVDAQLQDFDVDAGPPDGPGVQLRWRF